MCHYLFTIIFIHFENFDIVIARWIAGSLFTLPVSTSRSTWYGLKFRPQLNLAYKQFKLIKSSHARIKSHSS